MGGAHSTGMAMETADVVLMNDDLRRIPATIELSRRAHVVLWQNIALALSIKAAFLDWRWPTAPACGWRYWQTWA